MVKRLTNLASFQSGNYACGPLAWVEESHQKLNSIVISSKVPCGAGLWSRVLRKIDFNWISNAKCDFCSTTKARALRYLCLWSLCIAISNVVLRRPSLVVCTRCFRNIVSILCLLSPPPRRTVRRKRPGHTKALGVPRSCCVYCVPTLSFPATVIEELGSTELNATPFAPLLGAIRKSDYCRFSLI